VLFLEKIARRVRHSAVFEHSDWLWDRARPLYELALSRVSNGQLVRNINGTDRIIVSTQSRGVPETYEPQVWAQVMAEVRRGDVIADIGAFVGLYAVALGKRVGPQGKILAFEPAPENFASLREHVRLNGVSEQAELFQAAAGSEDGETHFTSQGIESHIGRGANSYAVKVLSLDTAIGSRKLDVLKVDVEGFEEQVLKGGQKVLGDLDRQPRVMFIEVHPYAWAAANTTSASFLATLQGFGYRVSHLDGTPATHIDAYGEVVARRIAPAR
jgi:FkbM family methyltransferase